MKWSMLQCFGDIGSERGWKFRRDQKAFLTSKAPSAVEAPG